METNFVREMRKLSILANQMANGIENVEIYEDVRDVAKTISEMVNSKDAYNQGHSERKAFYAALIAHELGLGNREIEIIKISTLLHDIGKIGIDEELLQKRGKLNKIEFKTVKKHPLISERILTPVGFPEQVLSAVRSHHESPDGKGYPDGLCENEIPIEASIIKVADAFGAMTVDRPYRPALSTQDAIRQLKESAGTGFDSKVVAAFQQVIELEEKRKTKKTYFTKRILVGNEELLNTNLLAYGLEKEGFDTLCAYSGEDVLEKVYNTYPDLILLNVSLPDISITNICRRLKNDPRSTYIPIITFGAKSASEEIKILESGADGHITKIFDTKKVASQINTYLRRTDHEKSLDPLTGLPGNFFIKGEIKKRINQQEKFAVLYLNLDNLKAFNKVYGFFQGDKVIKLTAEIINETIKNIGTSTDFIGHRGGDEFVVITSLDKVDSVCHQIISTFDKEIKSFYLPDDLNKGYIIIQEKDEPSIFPIMTISIGILTNEKIKLDNYFQVHELTLEAKEEARALPGSSYYKKV
ncbi:MAG: HD domain-containing phosphohydrolase [bacterium]